MTPVRVKLGSPLLRLSATYASFTFSYFTTENPLLLFTVSSVTADSFHRPESVAVTHLGIWPFTYQFGWIYVVLAVTNAPFEETEALEVRAWPPAGSFP